MVQLASGIVWAVFTASLLSSENCKRSEIFHVNSKKRKKRLKALNKMPGIYSTFAVFPDRRSHNATISSDVQNFFPIRATVFVVGSKSFKFSTTETAASCVSR